MRLVASVVTVIVAAMAFAPAAGARRHRHSRGTQGASTFDGSCQFSGEVRFVPPLTNTPSEGRDLASASGQCSGSFTDRRGHVHQLSGTQVDYFAKDRGLTSCAEGVSSGGGFFAFPWGRLAFGLTETRGSGGAALELTGRSAGSASGKATLSASENPVVIAQDCAGPGLSSVAVDITVASTPSISG